MTATYLNWGQSATRSTRRWLGLAILACSLSLPIVMAEDVAPPAAAVERTPAATDELIAEKVVKLVGEMHFSHPTFNDAMSAELFDAYFRRLDPERSYFLQSDIDEFTPYRDILDTNLGEKGKMDFAFAAFSRLLQRMHERHAYLTARLDQPFDYTGKAEMLIDRVDAPWARDEAEMNAIWDARMMNQMIVLMLGKEEDDAAAAAAAAQGETVDKGDITTDPRKALGLEPKTPKERIAQRYSDYERLMMEKDGLDVMEMYLSTFTSLCDPHSTYSNWRTFEDFNNDMKLSFDGIGATLSSVDGYTYIVSIITGGPASRDGRLQGGDIVVAVGQGDQEPESVVNLSLDKVVRKIRGEKNSVVKLWVQKSIDDVPRVIDIVRGEVKIADKEAKGEVREVTLPDGGTYTMGVVTLPMFYADAAAVRRLDPNAKSATNDVKRLITDMIESDNIDGVVMDLRGNGGGYLTEAISLSGLFIPTGPVVQIHYPGATEVKDDEDKTYIDLPLVVMVDRGTASASEIFAAAIQDYGRGVVVGDKSTHGKGTVQDVIDLTPMRKTDFRLRRAKPGALKLTVAKYYRVNGGSTQQKGVEPDITLPNFRDQMEIGEAYLPHVMDWDEIPAQQVKRTPHAVERLIPTLLQNSLNRREEEHIFSEMQEIIDYFNKRRERTHISLNLDARRALRAEDEAWTKRRDALLAVAQEDVDDEPVIEAPVQKDAPKDAAPNDEAEAEDTPTARDIYLDEGLNILADLLRLTNHPAVARDQGAPATETQN